MPGLLTLTLNPAVDIATEVDKIVGQKKLRCDSPDYDPGGGGINVARVVKRLGFHEVSAVFPVGGSSGMFLEELLREEGVVCHAIAVRARTRESFSVGERSSREQFRFVLPGAELLESEWNECLDQVAGMIGKFEWIVASGSLPPGVPTDFYARVARLARRAGVYFVLDSSGEPLRKALEEGVHLVKPNQRELQELAQAEGKAPEVLARELVARGNSHILIHSLGAKGAVLVTEDGERKWDPLPVEVKSTIGAGDSFLGGAVFSLMRGDSPVEACRWGMAAAAATLRTPGTGLCRLEEVRRWYAEVAP